MTAVLDPDHREWVAVSPHLSRRVTVELPRVGVQLYRLSAGYLNPLHSHPNGQLDVILQGSGTHRSAIARRVGKRVVQAVETVTVQPGECYYVPSGVPHEFLVGASGPVTILEILLAPQGTDAPGVPFLGRPAARRGSRWVRHDDRGARRLVIARTEEAEFVYYELPAAYHGTRHLHPEAQVGVCLSGTVLHRLSLSVRRGRRTVRTETDLVVRPGDSYYIPSNVPHESWVRAAPAMFLDVALRKPGHRASSADAAPSVVRAS